MCILFAKDLELFGEFSTVVPCDEYIKSPIKYKNVQMWQNPDYPTRSQDYLKNSLKGEKSDDYFWDDREGSVSPCGGYDRYE